MEHKERNYLVNYICCRSSFVINSVFNSVVFYQEHIEQYQRSNQYLFRVTFVVAFVSIVPLAYGWDVARSHQSPSPHHLSLYRLFPVQVSYCNCIISNDHAVHLCLKVVEEEIKGEKCGKAKEVR